MLNGLTTLGIILSTVAFGGLSVWAVKKSDERLEQMFPEPKPPTDWHNLRRNLELEGYGLVYTQGCCDATGVDLYQNGLGQTLALVDTKEGQQIFRPLAAPGLANQLAGLRLLREGEA